jgi:hypothetical protein
MSAIVMEIDFIHAERLALREKRSALLTGSQQLSSGSAVLVPRTLGLEVVFIAAVQNANFGSASGKKRF